MGSHDFDELYVPAFWSFFYKYWPDDGLVSAETSYQHLKQYNENDSCDRRNTYFISF